MEATGHGPWWRPLGHGGDQWVMDPLPRVDDTLDTLAGSRLFTALDLASGYWQVEVAEEDQPKTAFTTPEGLFQFRVMPFGLCNAPATFQRQRSGGSRIWERGGES